MEEIGELLGGLIIFFYGLTVLKYIIRFINRNFQTQLVKNERFYAWYRNITIIIMRNHNLFGLLTVVFLLAHFLVQYGSSGLNITGSIAASTMITQVLLGIYGAKAKNKWKHWIWLHRMISIIILIAILIHIK